MQFGFWTWLRRWGGGEGVNVAQAFLLIFLGKTLYTCSAHMHTGV